MPLDPAELRLGSIAYFDANLLNQDHLIEKTGDIVRREDAVGDPFVCYMLDHQSSLWTPLTLRHRRERLGIEREWIDNALGLLATKPVFLQDGKNTYRGETERFADASPNDGPFLHGRPTLTEEAIERVLQVVTSRGGFQDFG